MMKQRNLLFQTITVLKTRIFWLLLERTHLPKSVTCTTAPERAIKQSEAGDCCRGGQKIPMCFPFPKSGVSLIVFLLKQAFNEGLCPWDKPVLGGFLRKRW